MKKPDLSSLTPDTSYNSFQRQGYSFAYLAAALPGRGNARRAEQARAEESTLLGANLWAATPAFTQARLLTWEVFLTHPARLAFSSTSGWRRWRRLYGSLDLSRVTRFGLRNADCLAVRPPWAPWASAARALSARWGPWGARQLPRRAKSSPSCASAGRWSAVGFREKDQESSIQSIQTAR